MTYLEVVQALNNAADNVAAPDYTFIHGKRPDASLQSIQTKYPLIWVPPFRESYDLKTQNIERQITVCFFLQDSPNKTLEERQTLIQQAWDYQHDFMQQLYNGFDFMIKTFTVLDIIATPEYAQLAGTVSGYSVSFKLKSKITSC
jgi:hypothetical protein